MALSPKYTLYYTVRSPFGRRVRVALQKLAITFEARETDSFNLAPEVFEMNPLGMTPVLVINDGKQIQPLPDSGTILEHLHETYGGKIWPSDPVARVAVRAASTLAVGLMSNTVAWFLETKRSQPAPEALNEYLENIERTLLAISKTSLRALPWKVSDFQFTQAGYDLYIALEYLANRQKMTDWPTRYPELMRFVENHRQRQDLSPTSPPPM